jgi:hypothetical protein
VIYRLASREKDTVSEQVGELAMRSDQKKSHFAKRQGRSRKNTGSPVELDTNPGSRRRDSLENTHGRKS